MAILDNEPLTIHPLHIKPFTVFILEEHLSTRHASRVALKSQHEALAEVCAIMRQRQATVQFSCWAVEPFPSLSLTCVPKGLPYMSPVTYTDECEYVCIAVGGMPCLWLCWRAHVRICLCACFWFWVCVCVSSLVAGAYRLCAQRFPNPVFWNEPSSCCGLERLLPWRRLRDDKMLLLSSFL